MVLLNGEGDEFARGANEIRCQPPWSGNAMTFVELDRCFVPLKKDQEPILDVGIWGRKFAGWIDWPQLLDYRRVVLLAEASSGKSEEFRSHQQRLSAEGKPAFFVRIEELAELGFEAALEPSSAKSFADWRDGAGEAFFFLDSIDEARLNRKSFETALKRFRRDLDRTVDRARIFISCRVTDWKGREDRGLVEPFARVGTAQGKRGCHKRPAGPHFQPPGRSSHRPRR